MKYTERLLQTKEDAEKVLAPAKSEVEKAQLGIAIAKLNVSIKGKENQLESLKGTNPLNIDAIVAAGDEVALEKRRLGQLEALSSELFGS